MADMSNNQCIFSALQLILWTHDLLVHYPLFIECPTNLDPAKEEIFRFSMKPSQPMKKGPDEELQHVERGDKRKRKAHATPIPSVPAKVVVPSLPPPLFALMP